MSSNWGNERFPCPCGESTKSIAISLDGGMHHCFTCNKDFPQKGFKKEQELDTPTVEKQNTPDPAFQKDWKFQYLPSRGVKAQVYEFFKCKTGLDPETGKPEVIQFPFANGRIQYKNLENKSFIWTGFKIDDESQTLFGQDRFPAGGLAITITEGALDACSVYQMFGQKYAVVATSNAQSAKRECAKAYEYLNSFEKIYLCFDSDGPGKEAAKSVARLFDFNKVYVVNLQRKDANEYLEAGEIDKFKQTWWNAKRFMPEGILSSYSDFDKIIDEDQEKPAIPYPWERLQKMSYGARTGELVLMTAQEGIGKTEIFRALEYHFLKTTDENIGIIHLEENKARTLKGLVGYEVKSPIHLPDAAIPKEEVKKYLREITKRDDRVHIYSHFGSDDPDVILSTVRFLAGSCGCKRIFMDHITMVVSGLAGDDERRALDYISTRLAMMVEELDFTLFLISHVNDEGQTRGSRNIGKVADLRIDLNRNLKAENEQERNTTYLTVSKNRYAGSTGPAGSLFFDRDTYMLNEADPDALPF